MLPRLAPAAAERRRQLLIYWAGEAPKILVPMALGVITIPIIVGAIIVLVWLPRWWAFRKEVRRMLMAIQEPAAATAGSPMALPATS